MGHLTAETGTPPRPGRNRHASVVTGPPATRSILQAAVPAVEQYAQLLPAFPPGSAVVFGPVPALQPRRKPPPAPMEAVHARVAPPFLAPESPNPEPQFLEPCAAEHGRIEHNLDARLQRAIGDSFVQLCHQSRKVPEPSAAGPEAQLHFVALEMLQFQLTSPEGLNPTVHGQTHHACSNRPKRQQRRDGVRRPLQRRQALRPQQQQAKRTCQAHERQRFPARVPCLHSLKEPLRAHRQAPFSIRLAPGPPTTDGIPRRPGVRSAPLPGTARPARARAEQHTAAQRNHDRRIQ